MNSLVSQLGSYIADGVERGAISTSSNWAEKYRIMGRPFEGPWTFDNHPWSRDIHDCTSEHIVGQKAAQMGFTEVAMNRTFFFIDIKRESVLYVLPTERPDAVDFSASRFDPALEASPHLKGLFSDTKNLGLKRAGTACLYVRSARSRSQLKSIPAGNLVFDEMDEMSTASIILGRERSSGQIDKTEFDLSTPTIPRFGINAEFERSDQRHFVFRCPHCNRYTELVFPECLVITAEAYYEDSIRGSYYKCKECNVKLDHDAKSEWLTPGIWQKQFEGRHVAGFHVNQMYSFVIKPWQFAVSAMRRTLGVEDEQEFYNSKLGLPHLVKGAKINDDDIDKCIGRYTKGNSAGSNQYICMGIDVGNKIHVEITEYLRDDKKAAMTADINLASEGRLITELTVDEFEELDELIFRYNVSSCVIDRHPEWRKAKEFANRFPGIVRTCITTGEKITGRDIVPHDWEDEASISIDKTSWCDVALRRVKAQTLKLPMDTSLEYRDHLKEPVRIYKRNAQGEPKGIYVTAGPDHFAMARTYCEIALKVGVTLSANHDIH